MAVTLFFAFSFAEMIDFVSVVMLSISLLLLFSLGNISLLFSLGSIFFISVYSIDKILFGVMYGIRKYKSLRQAMQSDCMNSLRQMWVLSEGLMWFGVINCGEGK
jgi:hypothetical protein